MGFVKEPDGVDFVIPPGQWNEEDTAIVSAFIRKHKEQQIEAQTKARSKRNIRKKHKITTVS